MQIFMGEASRTTTGESAQPSLLLGIGFGLLSSLGPLAIDLYLPAMPGMAREMAADSGAVQRTLSAFFLGLALAQIPLGTLGDRFGRRWPLIGGLILFILASTACALATSLEQLTGFRFLQGMGACAGTSSVRAMIRDRHSGHRAAQLMAFTFLVIGISPVLAPLAGSYLLQLTSWRGLFGLLAGGGLIAILAVLLFLRETLPPERRQARQSMLRSYGDLLATPAFIGWTLVAGLATTIPFAFVTAAPFIFSLGFALSAHEYSLLLALNAGTSIIATQFAPGLMKRLGARRLVLTIATIALVATAAIALAAMKQPVALPLFQLYSMLLFAIAGLILTPAAISALDAAAGGGAGAAAGLLGTLQLAITALASGVVSLLPSLSILPLVSVLGGAFAIMWVTAGLIGPRQARA
ncbi:MULTISPECIES: Bcr/CflA family efflux MFS transporter [unclassified Sphingobium]|uniref:Bcr/CflA family efflux MFS transporter n=1 Tax=unclassified Sphingobium TaxID=2611147 RepID=UPI001A18D3E1|nr:MULTISPECIES: Bcr/CflA family efflux MFS transporter [unclassified Sphingobium]MBG6120373.1 DHA1 family bicyclomycin/chloramphenicol resistance-like MFS transporter [Sphingobium sp. JAI105]